MSKFENLLSVVPNPILKLAIRALIYQRLRREKRGGIVARQERISTLLGELRKSPIAVLTEKANEQHYEVPAKFYQKVLGQNLKYSSCYFPEGVSSLTQAEDAMLKLCCERAEICDGMDVLELGCGWGSLSLFMAKHYPKSRIVAVSNSASQKAFIDQQATSRKLSNLEIITCDMNKLQVAQKFDRVISVEMFEHMRNYELLLQQISSWLKADGKLFVHIFCNKQVAYLFESEGVANWMGRHFFSGGIMPSDHLLTYFQKDLNLEKHWRVNGTHYGKTAKAWCDNLDANKSEIIKIFEETYGVGMGEVWLVRWKLFFLSCEVLFGYANGEEWLVSHYLFSNKNGK